MHHINVSGDIHTTIEIESITNFSLVGNKTTVIDMQRALQNMFYLVPTTSIHEDGTVCD